MKQSVWGVVIIMAIALLAVAIASRVSPLKNLVYGTPAA